MLKKDISVVKHALLDGMQSKAVWDSFDRIKKFIDEAQNTSTNTQSVEILREILESYKENRLDQNCIATLIGRFSDSITRLQ